MWREYLESLLKAGSSLEEAERNVERNRSATFDGDTPRSGQFIFDVLSDEQTVGSLWLAQQGSTSEWFVYDVEIDEDFRGRGIGRGTMEVAEKFVRERGGTRLTLSVFGYNTVAQGLYQSLGYQVLASLMYKELSPGASAVTPR